MKRKLIDDRGRLFGVISVIDIGIVLVAFVLAAAVYSRFFSAEVTSVEVESVSFTYQLKVGTVRSYTVDALKVGDILYEPENGVCLGEIKNITVTDAVSEAVGIDGAYTLVPVEDRCDMVLDIEASGLISNGRYYAGRTFELGANAGVDFYTKYCSSSGRVLSVGR